MITLTSILLAATFLLIGAALGHLFSKKVNSGEKSVRDLEQKLAKTEQDLRRYQQEVTEHFVTTSHLTTNIAQSYRQMHEHLASSAMRLASPEVGRQLLKSGGSDFGLLDSNGNPLLDLSDIEVPRDYAPSVPGGILREDYGLAEAEQNDRSGQPSSDSANSANIDTSEEDDGDPTQSVA